MGQNIELKNMLAADTEGKTRRTTLTSPHFVKNVHRQKLALELRQQGKSYPDIVDYIRTENPELLTHGYSTTIARQDVVTALSSVATDISKIADKFIVAELVRLDKQDEETEEMVSVMAERIQRKLEEGTSIEGSVDRWTKLQELKLKIGNQRMQFIKDRMPSVSVSEEHTLSVDDFNQARDKMRNIVKINTKYTGSVPPPMAQDIPLEPDKPADIIDIEAVDEIE